MKLIPSESFKVALACVAGTALGIVAYLSMDFDPSAPTSRMTSMHSAGTAPVSAPKVAQLLPDKTPPTIPTGLRVWRPTTHIQLRFNYLVPSDAVFAVFSSTNLISWTPYTNYPGCQTSAFVPVRRAISQEYFCVIVRPPPPIADGLPKAVPDPTSRNARDIASAVNR